MKQILLLIVALLVTIVDVYAQNGFKISGKVANMPDGTVWLLGRMNPDKLDTLGRTELKSGIFELNGRVKSGCLALVVMTDMKTGFQLMLENTNYSLISNENGDVKIEGGTAQSLFVRFDEINRSIAEKRQATEKAAQSVRSREQMVSLQNGYNSFVKKAVDKQLDMIRANGNCFVSAYILAGMMQNAPLDILKELHGKFTDEVKNGYYGTLVGEQIARLEKISVGAIAPNFTVMTPAGDTISLHFIRGKVKLVDFWASWCAPCRRENPNLVKLYEEYHAKGFEVFSVSLDTDKAAWEKAIQDDKLPWKQGTELLQVPQVAILYAIKAIPHTILLDENNRIIAKDIRGKELRKKIAELLE
ncbi:MULTISPECIES: TlpA disulfide reductase family protein [Butyricimonas]|uniref:TlpA disulfide reductase family protein n=1 Tax=Butyricimonas TaxID=574697 RepID=UPI001D05C9FD|nr:MULTISPECIES: TlpA disulfide reductase family protein [Butyricimonas]MCB6972103.1 AhpC/TSA family protein [Butyricimonas synergistica]MCG4519334.1 AhpC/TSA family protein [Butyricimonas sp. DFI.6.44]